MVRPARLTLRSKQAPLFHQRGPDHCPVRVRSAQELQQLARRRYGQYSGFDGSKIAVEATADGYMLRHGSFVLHYRSADMLREMIEGFGTPPLLGNGS